MIDFSVILCLVVDIDEINYIYVRGLFRKDRYKVQEGGRKREAKGNQSLVSMVLKYRC
ncbi:hypothetical protein NIES80_19560 [Dolichospermum planctonicum]|uniref:Uncharacterized protein n=1 Tax=Dolichospermum planctonicum TaxID=136072 RepID=A0A480AES8_9CYAN|nr:hypothetical protein NIES80_19560 [Dolichospermum planctonicum]